MRSSVAIRLVRLAAFALAFGGAASSLAAQPAYTPAGKIQLVTHASVGNSIDVFLRTLGDIWTREHLVGEHPSMENVTGAGGDRARRYVAIQNRGNAQMLFGYTPQMMIAPIRTKSELSVESYTPIALMTVEPTVLFVNTQTPYKSVKDLIAAARAKPKAILQGGGAFGGPPSLMGRMMADEAKVEIAYTPFKTSGESVLALLGGHVHFIMEQPSECAEHVKAGKLRMLATSVPLEEYPDVKTFSALGMHFRTLKQFRGVMAPPGIPPAAAAFYVDLLERTRKTPEWRHYVKQYGMVEHWLVGSEFATFLRDEEATYRRLMVQLKLLKG
jgi:putative tricarboxylic transport membrane protein